MYNFNSYTDDNLKSHFEYNEKPFPKRYKAISVEGDNGNNQFVEKVKVFSFDNPNEILALGVISDFIINGKTFTDSKSLLKSLNSLVFNKGGDGGEGPGVKSNHNTAIGEDALAGNISSPDNSAFGNKALNKLKTGEMNTVAGSGAAANVADSTNSTVVGAYAAPATPELNNDTIVGAAAAYSWVGGTYASLSAPGVTRKSGNNVIIGNWAAINTKRGYANVIIGDECGYNFQNYGDYNVMIGKGITKERQYAGDGSVLIGNYCPNGYHGTFYNYKFAFHSQPPIGEGGEGPYAIPTIYGDFRERTVGVGGKLTLNPQYNANVDNDETFVATKIVVANDAGQLAFKVDTGWHEPILLNNVENYGEPYQNVRFRRQGDLVVIEGVVKGNPTTPESVILFSLTDKEFWPKVDKIFGTPEKNIIVEKTGYVRATNFDGEFTNLAGISFYIN